MLPKLSSPRALICAFFAVFALLTPLYAQNNTPPTPEPDKVGEIAAGNPDVTFLDQLATGGIPGAIGELLGAQADAMGTLFAEGAKAGTLNADLIARKHIADKVANINQQLGRMLAVLDVGGKVYAGDYSEAAWSAGLAGLTELAGTQTGKSTLAYVGCGSTAPVTAAVLAVQVYRESAKQVAETKGAVMLESLYGGVEGMVRDRGRKLGDGGDPFPVNPENVEKVWRRILSDQDFRGRFGQYVTDVLQREWPEPGFFDKMDAYVADPIIDLASGQSTPKGGFATAAANPGKATEASTASDRIEQTAQQKLQANKDAIKGYIAGLISTLNSAAKKEEARMMAVKALQELQRFFKTNGANMEEGMAKMTAALKRFPEAQDWAARCGARVDEAIKNKSTDSLSAERSTITMYVRDVIRWIPATGRLGEERNKVYARLRAAYEKSLQGTKQVNQELAERAKKPPVPKGEFKADPRSYYDQYFAKVVKPFDWDGSGGPEAAKAKLKAYLGSGQFKSPKDPTPMPAGRKAMADVIMEAWTKQNFAVAGGGGDYLPGSVPAPDRKKTIKGYEEQMQAEIGRILSNPPQFSDGSAKDAFSAAGAMARDAASSMVAVVKHDYDEAALWMSALHQQYLDYSLQLWGKASDINNELSAFGCTAFGPGFAPGSTGTPASFKQAAKYKDYQFAPEDKNDAPTFGFIVDSRSPATWQTDGRKTWGGRQVTLAEASSLLSSTYSQSGIGKVSEQPGALLSDAITSYMDGKAGEYSAVAGEIRRNYSGLVEAVKAHCDALNVSVDVWDSAVNVAQGDLDAIRKFVDPTFMNSDSFNYFKVRRSATPAWATQQRSTALALLPRAEQVAGEWESDAFYLRRLGRLFGLWIDKGVEQGILGQSGGMGSVGSLTLGELRSDPQAGAQWVSKPYPHFVTADEKARFVAQMRGDWDSSGLGKFATDKAQWLQKIVEDYLKRLGDVETFGEENFLTSTAGGTLMFPATATTLAKAEEMVKKMQPGTREFEDLYSALISTVPMQIEYPGNAAREKFCDLSAECLRAPLAPRYVAMRDKFKELLKNHRSLAGKMAEDEKKKQIAEARSKLPGLLDQLKTRLQKGDELIKTSLEAKSSADIKNAIDRLNDFRTKLTDEPYQAARSLHDVLYSATIGNDGKNSDPLVLQAGNLFIDVGRMSAKIAEAVDKLSSHRDTPVDDLAGLRQFYDDFKKAYEAKNDAKVMSFIGSKWSAGDGTSLVDLEDYLRNSFTVFDQIRYSVSNLRATKNGENGYSVSYDLTITGKIFDTSITHEEKSSVVEEVTVDASGRMKISKTLDGKFWYVR